MTTCQTFNGINMSTVFWSPCHLGILFRQDITLINKIFGSQTQIVKLYVIFPPKS